MAKKTQQAIAPQVKLIADVGPLELIQQLDAAFPNRSGPHLTTEQLCIQQGQQLVINWLSQALGVESVKEYRRVHRT